MDHDAGRSVLGERVRKRRRALGMTVDAAGSRAGLSHVTWAKVEHGKEVRPRTYAAVERTLGWSAGSAAAILEQPESTVSWRETAWGLASTGSVVTQMIADAVSVLREHAPHLLVEVCAQCQGAPPAGFACRACGTAA